MSCYTVQAMGPKRGINLNVCAVLVLLSVGFSACSDSIDGPKWDVKEGESEDKTLQPFRQGTYRLVEVNVHDEGCEPSLETVVSTYDDWPPPRVVLDLVHANEEHDAGASIRIIEPRTGGEDLLGVRLNADLSPPSPAFGEAVWPGDLINGLGCTSFPWSWLRHHVELTVSQRDNGDIEVRSDAEWFDFKACATEAQRAHQWLPQSPCRETYSLIYALEETCEPIETCKVWMTGVSSGGSEDGLYYYTPSFPNCSCEEP